MALFGLSLSAGENRRLGHRSGTRRQDWRRGRRGARTRFRPRIDALEERTLLSNVVTVTNDNDSGIGSLRDAINNATSGEIVNFAHSAYGTITLTSGPLQVNEIDLTIQGPGAKKLTISGGGNFTDFILLSPLPPTSPPPASFVPNSVNISGLTIASGNAINNGFGDGGGILSFDALTVSNSVLVNNQAPGDFGSGGAIYSGCCGNASLSLDHDVFARNSVGSSSVTDGIQQGGAIFNADGVATISSSTFTNNQALGYSAQGGAISSNGGTLDVAGTTFLGNQAVGGSSTSGLGGSATGGAIAAFSSVLNLSADTFFGNEALGGSSPMGVQSAIGGAVYSLSGNPFAPNPTSTISNSLFLGNEAIAGIGGGPLALTGGGAIGYSSNTPLNVSNTNFLGNQVVGSRGLSGGAGTEADGGAIWAEGSILTIQGGLIVGNNAVGGRGGDAQGSNGGDGGTGGDGGIASLQ
ncbi:MAG TPA: hypothetical protein VKA15_27700, partial [Isosphaeraceae bacterium]|nr:hypothetical protein [Isosphaeraceae bacterium]